MKSSSLITYSCSIVIGITSLVLSTTANAVTILNGVYFQSPPTGDYEVMEVRGNRFRFVYEGSDLTDPVDPWKSRRC
jgi:hypothetical protein